MPSRRGPGWCARPSAPRRTGAAAALAEAAAGHRVALVCSGDAGVYGLASLVFELAPAQPGLDPVSDITVVPGVTAALAAAAAVGAPLGHDHASISLSDLLTPWPVIERRLLAAAEADLVVSLYNPRSAGRDWQLGAARDLLAARRPPGTPVGIVTNAGRGEVHVELTTLAGLEPSRRGHDGLRGHRVVLHPRRRRADGHAAGIPDVRDTDAPAPLLISSACTACGLCLATCPEGTLSGRPHGVPG